MNFYQKVSKLFGSVYLQIEGFFTERVINLCMINNIKIWNIANVTSGMVRFEIALKDIKRIKPIIKKCKCSFKVLKKQGIYFNAFRYRKRKFVIPLIIILIIGIYIFNSFIWNVRVVGNNEIDESIILEKAKICGIYKGKFSIKLDTNYIIKLMKKEMPDLAWIGMEKKGTTIIIKIVERTTIPEDIIYNKYSYGDIVAKKSGVITKIVAENGTAVHKQGSYVQEGMTLIKGIIKSEKIGDYKVRASGIARANIEYIFEKEYKYEEIVKQYSGKNKYTIGVSFNNSEICLNYLNKSKKYDTLKTAYKINIFSNVFSFDIYKFNQYNELTINYTFDDLKQIALNDKNDYLESLILDDSNLVSESEFISKTETGIYYRNVIVVNENIGVFKGE